MAKRVDIDDAIEEIVRVVRNLDDLEDIARVYSEVVHPAHLVSFPVVAIDEHGNPLNEWEEYELELEE